MSMASTLGHIARDWSPPTQERLEASASKSTSAVTRVGCENPRPPRMARQVHAVIAVTEMVPAVQQRPDSSAAASTPPTVFAKQRAIELVERRRLVLNSESFFDMPTSRP